jgi:hypothetical protein
MELNPIDEMSSLPTEPSEANPIVQTPTPLTAKEKRAIAYKRYYEQQKTLFDKDLVSRDIYLESKENYEHSVELFEINQLRAKNDSLILATEMIQLDQELKKMEKTLSKNGTCHYLTTENTTVFDQKATQFIGTAIVSEHVLF